MDRCCSLVMSHVLVALVTAMWRHLQLLNVLRAIDWRQNGKCDPTTLQCYTKITPPWMTKCGINAPQRPERRNAECKASQPVTLKIAMINIYNLDKSVCAKHMAAHGRCEHFSEGQKCDSKALFSTDKAKATNGQTWF